jgi:hypothetical protein
MKELLKALHAALSEMQDPKKNASNPHFKNKYADLGACLDSIEGPLHKHGLVLTQQIAFDQGLDFLETKLWHVDSGQCLESRAQLKPEKQTPQGVGSAISYMRRYSIKSLFGLADTDDDGEAAAGREKPAKKAAIQPLPVVKHDPFESVGEAATALEKVRTEEELGVVRVRIMASKFLPEELGSLKAVGEAAKARVKKV